MVIFVVAVLTRTLNKRERKRGGIEFLHSGALLGMLPVDMFQLATQFLREEDARMALSRFMLEDPAAKCEVWRIDTLS